MEAFDFSAARSEEDAILIAKARGMKKGQRMTPEQANALRRKVGGTAKDYWKGWVDVKGSYVDKVRRERERERGRERERERREEREREKFYFILNFFFLLSLLRSPPRFSFPLSPQQP